MSFLRSSTSFCWRCRVCSFNSYFLLFNLNLINDCLFHCGNLKLWSLVFRTFKRLCSLPLLLVDHWRSDKAFTLQELFVRFLCFLSRLSLFPLSLCRGSALSRRLSGLKYRLFRVQSFLNWVDQRLLITLEWIWRLVFNSKHVNFQLVQNELWNRLLRSAETPYELDCQIISSNQRHLNLIDSLRALLPYKILKP